jgi:hypothetical protein
MRSGFKSSPHPNPLLGEERELFLLLFKEKVRMRLVEKCRIASASERFQ